MKMQPGTNPLPRLGFFVLVGTCLLIISLAASMPRPASTTPNEDGITTNVGIAMEPVAVHAAGRGNPWVNFRDGLAVETRYTGPEALVQTMQAGLAVPLALATGDFDEDGVTDVVSAYVGPTGGILALHPGNFDALYPASFVGRRAART